MNILLPNWNLSFKPRFYECVSCLKRYAKKNSLMLSEVTNLSDINILLRRHHIDYIDIDRVFIGW